jgi:hypothetical protein
LHQQENQENLTAVNGSSAHSRHYRAEESEAMIAAAESSKKNTSHVMSVAKFEPFFRIAAGLNVDKQDLKRYSDFINQKVYDLLDRIRASDNIEVLTHTEIVPLYGIGRSIRRPPVEQRIRPSSVAGNQHSRRVHRRRRAVRISQAGRRRNRRGAVVRAELHSVLANGAAASARVGDEAKPKEARNEQSSRSKG